MEEEDYGNISSQCIIIPKVPLENENVLKLDFPDKQDGQLSPTSNSNSASTSSNSIGSIDLLISEDKAKRDQQHQSQDFIFSEKIKILNIPNDTIIISEEEEEKNLENILNRSTYLNKNKENESMNIYSLIKKTKHPYILGFSFLVEVSTILLFIIEDISHYDPSIFALFITIINGINFWFTKNISGRIIFGMHWWKEVKPNYQERLFLGRQIDFKISSNYDNNFLWSVLYSSTTIWGIFLLVKIFEMSWIMIIPCFVSFLLSFFNAFGYNRCANEQKIRGIIDTNV